MMKPLFIPLNTEYFNAFKSGDKNEEIRLYGPRWNYETCKVGRDVVLSKGYGKHERLTGKVCFFVNIHGSTLSSENKKAALKLYGTLDVLIALIGIEDIKPQVN